MPSAPCDRGNGRAGKEILTRLLKADQNNPTYWIWMSAAVETARERIYCLETALKLDPGNATAKRGLVLLGGLSPDENIQPFPLNRPRPWEEDLLLAHEKPQQKVAGANPLTRMLGVVLAALAVTAVAAYAFFLSPRSSQFLRPLGAATLGALSDVHADAHVRECHGRRDLHAERTDAARSVAGTPLHAYAALH